MKRILFGSKALGDTIAWIPYVEEYRKINNIDITVGCEFYDLLIDSYPQIKFISRSQMLEIGFDLEIGFNWIVKDGIKTANLDIHPVDFRTIPIQKLASDLLGIDFKEIQPNIKPNRSKPSIEGDYVCISVQSTLQCKYWNNPTGWQEVVDFLNSEGLKVVLIDQYRSFGCAKNNIWNYPPNNVIDKSSLSLDLWSRINDLAYAKFFIGLGSGLSWLSWAVGTHVMMISGFSKPFCEFKSNITRIHNNNVCNGCYNDESLSFNNNDWLWCPKFKGTENAFECTKSITAKQVIDNIKSYLSNKT